MMIRPSRPDDSGAGDFPPTGEGDSSLEDLVEECTNRLQAGEDLDLEELAAAHPAYADRLRRLLPSLRMMAEVARTSARAVPAVLPRDGVLRPPPSGPFELGDYRVLRVIGRGGMGIVYEAMQLSLGRRVALKMLPFAAALDPHQLRRFQIEAQAAAQLHHTSIVPVFSVGCEHGVHFYAMQYIEGRTLAAVIRERREASRAAGDGPSRPPADREYVRSVARLGIQAAEALDHAHRQGIIHRDVKPANLLVDGRGGLWITDFGLARFVNEAGLTVTGDLIGTLRYMSPEQALARRLVLDHRTDLYSLGASLYELLTLRPVVDGRDRQEVLRRIAQEEPIPPRRIDPAIPRDLETILLKSLAREPEGRYATAQELAEDLRSFLEHRPIRARRPGLMERSAKWFRRHPALAGSMMVALIGAVLGLATHTILTDRALREALRQRDEARARGLVGALAVAEIRLVPELLRQLAPVRSMVRDQLEALADDRGSTRDAARHRLHAALALLPDHPDRAGSLGSHLLREDTPPDEVLVIGQVLREHRAGDPVVARLWSELPADSSDLTDRQLRALGALAQLDPTAARWRDVAAPAVARLVRENPLQIGPWREVFRPVRSWLTGPLLSVHGDRARRAVERDLAFALLLDYAAQDDNSHRDEDLSDLIADAESARFERIIARISDRGRACAHLARRLDGPPASNAADGERRARIDAALIRLGEPERAWPWYRRVEDPTVRTELIHSPAEYGVDPGLLVARLDGESTPEGRRALLLALGEYPADRVSVAQSGRLVDRLVDWYRNDPDPGVHGALDWLLRRWGESRRLATIVEGLRAPEPVADRGWYVNRQGQTFTVIRAPEPFLMGSPVDEPGRDSDESRYLVRIPRSFAISAREVTIAEYRRLVERKHPNPGAAYWVQEFRPYAASSDCPVVAINWEEVIEYCNVLSEAEGIPESEWFYPKDRRVKDSLASGLGYSEPRMRRKGYRLPTEAEWEYACRAGSADVRPIGRSAARLAAYAWLLDNAGGRLHPAGELRPNELGLFDMMGNAWEWVQDPYARIYHHEVSPEVQEQDRRVATLDGEKARRGFDEAIRVFGWEGFGRMRKGGSFQEKVDGIRPARRSYFRGHRFDVGFRVVRTID